MEYNNIRLILLSLFVQLILSSPDPLDELGVNVNIGVQFKKMEYSNFCSGSWARITSEATCKAAAIVLGLKWGNSWDGPGDFPGCVHTKDNRNGVYFNTSPNPSNNPKVNANYAEICQTVPYKKMAYSNFCSGSWVRITSEAMCKAAAIALDLKWGKSWDGPGDFPGCLHTKDHRNGVYFNTSPNPSNNSNANANYAEMCQAEAQAGAITPNEELSTLNGGCSDYIYLDNFKLQFWHNFGGYMKKEAGKSSYKQMDTSYPSILSEYRGRFEVYKWGELAAYTDGDGPGRCVYDVRAPWFYRNEKGHMVKDLSLKAFESPADGQCKWDDCAGCNVTRYWHGHDYCCSRDCDNGWVDLIAIPGPRPKCLCGH